MTINTLGDFADYVKEKKIKTRRWTDEKGNRWIKILKNENKTIK